MTFRRPPKGITLVELIITATVMSVMILTIIPLFTATTRGYTSLEVATVLSSGTQEAVTRMQNRLAENKRLFGRDTIGIAMLGRVTPSVSPAALSGSQLPVIDPNASLSPSSSTFVAANTGNCLLFAGVDQTVEVSTTNGSGSVGGVRVDVFTFNYYYLSPNSAAPVGGVPGRDLWEWHSKPYVDYVGLITLPDVTFRNNVIKELLARNYNYAFNSSATVVTAAFYQLQGSTPWLNSASAHNIDKAEAQKMVRLIRGTSIGSFNYSVSPNTGPGFKHKYDVPSYSPPATTADNFPSGFETVIVGPAGTRRVFARIVMAAQGSFKGYQAYEQVLLVAARDLY
jgi:hypothetical protein